ncbi:MAG: hypothetical protein PHU61_01905 [Candidatus Absconditabacteria bacterium]|nr:hypothetical protein [Candidatus Absconditabacteria bacterium]MDD3868464.1 hypothetical protein [Candidatus Absconditabacteria bacterium]MDD4713962.1 hypothetical protein [Candidatus Absconditabacteria bacterium]
MLFNSGDQNKIKKTAPDSLFNTEAMLPISEIRDGVIVLKDGGLRSVIRVEGLNLDLRNFEEQEVVLEQYKRFLNGLSFPLQILIRNSYLNLTDYLSYIKGNLKKIDNVALHQQGDQYLSFLQGIDAKQGLIFVKEFYIIVPYYETDQDTSQVGKSRWDKFLNVLNAKDDVEAVVERYRKFIKGEKQLQTRVSLVMEGLSGMRMNSEQLTTSEIVSLLFRMYNPLLDSAQAKFVE